MSIRTRALALAILAILLLGCAAPRLTKPGLTQEQWNKDTYECMRENQTVSGYGGYIDTSTDWGMYYRCMAARGYVRQN